MQRFIVLDVVKAIAILAVVLGHIATPFSNFIFAWHMPAFFFLSGILMCVSDLQKRQQTLFQGIKKDFFYLGKFYLLFGFIGISVSVVKANVLGRNPMDLVTLLEGLLFYMDYEHLQYHYGFILWFLPSLFWAKAVTKFLLKMENIVLIICLAMAICFFAIYIPNTAVFGIRAGLLGCIWTVIGYFYWKYGEKLRFIENRFIVVVILIALFLIKIPTVNLSQYSLENPIGSLCYSLMVISLLLNFGEWIGKRKGPYLWIDLFSKYSIYVMAIHVYTNNIADLLANRFLGGAWEIKFIFSILLLGAFLYMIDQKKKRKLKNEDYRSIRN